MFARQARAAPTPCKICGVPALYSYFGTIVCQSCKMFFKRNGEKKKDILKCEFNGKCRIDRFNRRSCAACRLEKCFTSGMCSDLIRGSRCRKNRTRKRKHQNLFAAMEVAPAHEMISSQKKISNWHFLKNDPYSFNDSQWILLSNLINCFDEHSGFHEAQRFISSQSNLPIKFRFKSKPVSDFITELLNRSQSLYEKNQDFHSLCDFDRAILLRTAAIHVASLSVHVIMRPARLMDNPAFNKSHEILFGSPATIFAERIANQLDCDSVVMKLLLAILAFSTLTYAFFTKSPAQCLTNPKQVLKIQDAYIDLLWRYLVFKYSYNQAVLRLTNLVRCIFSAHQAIVRAMEKVWYTDVIDTLIEQTEQSMLFN